MNQNTSSVRRGRWLAIGLALIVLPRVAGAQTYTLSPSPFLTATDTSGKPINNACVWTYTAGTTTAATTYSDTAGTWNTNPIRTDASGRFTTAVYLIAGQSYKFVYEGSCTPPAHGTTIRTQDNIAGVPASSATVDVTATAGETITAGHCAYLSDGSGSKTAGQWYNCDAGAAYSSTTPLAGLAVAAIASGSSGTVRLAGSVTGLTSLTVGADYYVGTAGAISTSAATNARKVGRADSTASLIVATNPAVANVVFVDDFRLSLTSATCVTTGDVTAATTLYLTPCTGNRITLFDTAGNPTTYTTAEVSIAVPATTSQLYDVFVYANSGVPTLELVAWTNDTTRATALARTNGRWTKSGDSTRLYVGSFRTTGTSGQTEDSAVKRYVWNAYQRRRRGLFVADSTASWNYTTATYRQFDGSTANQVDVVIGLAEAALDLTVASTAQNGTAGGVQASIAIGEDSTSTATTTGYVGGSTQLTTTNQNVPIVGRLVRTPAVGRHYYAALEKSTATGTTSWLGGGNGYQTGLTGWIEG